LKRRAAFLPRHAISLRGREARLEDRGDLDGRARLYCRAWSSVRPAARFRTDRHACSVRATKRGGHALVIRMTLAIGRTHSTGFRWHSARKLRHGRRR
jgi:hypothetical protein